MTIMFIIWLLGGILGAGFFVIRQITAGRLRVIMLSDIFLIPLLVLAGPVVFILLVYERAEDVILWERDKKEEE